MRERGHAPGRAPMHPHADMRPHTLHERLRSPFASWPPPRPKKTNPSPAPAPAQAWPVVPARQHRARAGCERAGQEQPGRALVRNSDRASLQPQTQFALRSSPSETQTPRTPVRNRDEYLTFRSAKRWARRLRATAESPLGSRLPRARRPGPGADAERAGCPGASGARPRRTARCPRAW